MHRHAPSKAETVANSAWFNTFWHVLIVLSAALNGYHAHLAMVAVLSGQPDPRKINLAELIFSCLFLLELIIRIGILRWEYFLGDDRYWNITDALLIISSIVS